MTVRKNILLLPYAGKADVISPVEIAMMDTAINIITPVKIRPMGVIGTRSPYPTVLNVSTANQSASKRNGISQVGHRALQYKFPGK